MITGFYLRTLFRDEKDGYTVFLLSTDTGTVSLSGHIPPYVPWTPLHVSEETDASGKLRIADITESSAGLPHQQLDQFLKECGTAGSADRKAVLDLLPGRELFTLAESPGFLQVTARILGREKAAELRNRILLPGRKNRRGYNLPLVFLMFIACMSLPESVESSAGTVFCPG